MKKLFFVFTACCVLVGCGSDETDPATNNKSGYCGYEVVSDHNDVVRTCNYADTSYEIRSCKNKAQSFIDKYPNINCTAGESSDFSVDDEEVQITNSKFKRLVENLEDFE